MKIIVYLSLVTLAYTVEGHNLHKRVLPTNEKCDPINGVCRKGDWVAEHIAGCKYQGKGSCSAENSVWWSWTVDVAVHDTCQPIRGRQFECGASGTNTRCVCSKPKIYSNECKCQYWPAEDVGAHAPAFCTAYYVGGTFSVHHWACCNNCNDIQNTCDGVTWHGGSGNKYCSSCGQSTGGGRVKYYFNCGSCDTQQLCKSQCSRHWYDTLAGFCWRWVDCFKGCCLKAANQPRYKRDVSELSFCGDGICSKDESSSSCPTDCCYQINSVNCTSDFTVCSPSCCQESECCLDGNPSSGSNKGVTVGIPIVVLLLVGTIICITAVVLYMRKNNSNTWCKFTPPNSVVKKKGHPPTQYDKI